jgi:crotonobetainyl-CoA:carnitine CoA-transferase CaiB-like acyl-CoA transferase
MLPLAGIRVVEIAQNIAGPYAAEILALLGADVLKVERPEGDDARGWGPPFIDGVAPTFHAVNRNKRGITLDLKDPRAVAWLKERLAETDVLIQNLRPGALDDLGLGAEALRALNPRLVYCSLWAFGHKGPMRFKPGYEPMVQAFAGIFSVNGAAEDPPTRVNMQILDLGTGVWAALGCIAALLRRKETGEGAVVDASLYETALAWLGVHIAGWSATGQPPARHRSGSAKLVVFEAFAASDGEVIIAAANDRLFAKLAVALGRPDWAADARFRTNAGRIAHRAEIIDEIERIIATRTAAHWIAALEAAGVPCAPIQDLDQVMTEPQTAALGIVEALPGLDLQTIGLPLSFDGERPPVARRAPDLGEHNDETFDPRPRRA